MPRWYKSTSVVISIFFALTGFITLLNVAALWHQYQTVSWMALSYMGLDGLLAWGFYANASWLFPVLALNAAGLAVLAVLRFAYEPIASIIILGVGAGVAAFAYAGNAKQFFAKNDRWVGVLFIALWTVLFCYTINLI